MTEKLGKRAGNVYENTKRFCLMPLSFTRHHCHSFTPSSVSVSRSLSVIHLQTHTPGKRSCGTRSWVSSSNSSFFFFHTTGNVWQQKSCNQMDGSDRRDVRMQRGGGMEAEIENIRDKRREKEQQNAYLSLPPSLLPPPVSFFT